MEEVALVVHLVASEFLSTKPCENERLAVQTFSRGKCFYKVLRNFLMI
jgi:hypothetical protein